MTEATYTHGHHDSVLRSHRWRTAENSAAYLLPGLVPGMSLLDVGCGPGTITADLADRITPGPAVGLDASVPVLVEARKLGGDGPPRSLSFLAGNLFRLPFADATFDVVHAHQVLQHVGDPVAALVEMRRVARPGGTVAARDSDYPGMRYFPDDADLAAAFSAYGALTRVNGANWDAGRRLLQWAQAAGFASVVPSASVWCFATPEDRHWWGGLWADRFTESSMAEQLLDHGIATPADLARFAAAWSRWSESPDGWFAVIHGEILCAV